MKKKIRTGVFDAETTPFARHKDIEVFLWGLYLDDCTYYDFWGENCTVEFMEFLEELDEEFILYVHNGGKFDLFYLFDYLAEDFLNINGRIAQCKLKRNNKITIRDSYCALPLSLSSYKKDEVNYEIFNYPEREKPKNKKIIRDYCRTDNIYLFEFISEFRRKIGNHLTIAKGAIEGVKKAECFPIQRTSEYFFDLYKPYYFGGRVQCFGVGEFIEDLQYVDINSAYPRAMMDNHPCTTRALIQRGGKLPDKKKNFFATIYAKSKGALPLRDEKTKKLYFPDDDHPRIYKATNWEIYAGIETGTLEVLEVLEAFIFKDVANFEPYVDHWFSEKLDAKKNKDRARELIAKLMLNSAYGKFAQNGKDFREYKLLPYGQKPTDQKSCPDHEENDQNCEACFNLRWKRDSVIEVDKDSPNKISVYSRPDPDLKFYNVATAASITGWVRAYLWRAICASKGVLYCDTDSILCQKFGGDIGDQLGQWGLEAEIIRAYVANRKVYVLIDKDNNYKMASKGVKIAPEILAQCIADRASFSCLRQTPTYSLKTGVSYIDREVDLKNLDKNVCTTPPDFI